MDGLLRGLTGSFATTLLQLIECKFDALALEKLLAVLKSGSVNISRFYLINCFKQGFQGSYFRYFRSVPALQEVGVVVIDSVDASDETVVGSGIEFVKEGLQYGSLSTLKISSNNVSEVINAIMNSATTMQTLTKLCFQSSEFHSQGVEKFVAFLNHAGCNVQEIGFDNCSSLSTADWTQIFTAMNARPTLEIFSAFDVNEALLEAFILNIEGLRYARDMSFTESNNTISGKHEKSLISALQGNGIVETIQFRGFPQPIGYPGPCMSAHFYGQVEFITERNKMKKLVASAEDGNPANLVLGDWVDKLAGLLSLREGVSLACWLFQEHPGLFF
jgi:hypothetical protein